MLTSIFDRFFAPFWTPKGPQNRSKIDHVFDLFLNDFLEPLFEAFGLHLGSQNDPKNRPKRVSKRTHKNHRFCCYLLQYTLATLRVLKIIIFSIFFGPFLRYLFETSFSSILDPFGDLLGPFGHQKSTLKNTPKKDTKKELFYKPVLAREREARLNVPASSQARLNSSIA